jgi:hypothetical protein
MRILALLILFSIATTTRAESGCYVQSPENPTAKKGSIYPHPDPPKVFAPYKITATFLMNGKPAQGVLRIEQPRPTGGYWFSMACPLVDGKFPSPVDLSPEWGSVLYILVNDDHRQIGNSTCKLSDPNCTKGTILLKP